MTILATIVQGHEPNYICVSILVIIAIASFITFMGVLCSWCTTNMKLKNFLCVTVICVVLCILCSSLAIYQASDTRYIVVKATIDDTIPWREVNARYELIGQEDDLYTFKDRESKQVFEKENTK